jgi:hypothetical protein
MKTGVKITNTYHKTQRHEWYGECGHNILGVWHATRASEENETDD